MTQSEQRVLGMVRAIGRRWYRLQCTRFLAAALVLLLAWLLAMIVVDNLAMLRRTELLAGWGLLAAALVAWTLTIGYRLTLGRPRRERLALMYEARVPGHRNRLINSVQFLRSHQAEQDPMVRAALIENALGLDPGTAPAAVDFRPVHRMALLVLLFVVLLGGYAAWRPQWVLNAAERLLRPNDPAAHLLAVEMSITPGNTSVVEGQELKIHALLRTRAADYLPRSVELEYRVPGLDWKRAAMTTSASGAEFDYTLKAVWHAMEYRVRVGRSTSRDFQVTVRLRPRVEQLQVSVNPPEYTGRSVQVLALNAGNVGALAGSTVAVQLVASAELRQGHLELADAANVPLAIDAQNPRAARAEFTAVQNGTYAIHLVDREELSMAAPPQYTITVQPDEAPTATIVAPGRDLVLPADMPVNLAIEADDDIGVARVVLQTRTGTAEWKDLQEWTVAKLDVPHYAPAARLSPAELGLKPNEELYYRATAADHRRPEPNVGIGRTWKITVAAPTGGANLVLAQAKRLYESLEQILALQRQNRTEFDLSAPIDTVRQRQAEIRRLTLSLAQQQRQAPGSIHGVAQPLSELADGLMLEATQLLGKYEAAAPDRPLRKKATLEVMDKIIARLEEIMGRVQKTLAAAEKAFEVLEKLAPEEREKALQTIRDLVEKLRKFIPEQDKVIQDTQELVRKAEDLTDPDLRKLEQVKGTEDEWEKVFAGSVSDLAKLTEQGFADRTVANDYKEMVEQIEEASKNLNPKLMELAVPLEQAGRELAQTLAEDMEMWLPNSPDAIKWSMEEPLDHPEIPMAKLPDQLDDLIGDLIEEQDALNDMADDVTSGWADSMSTAGWGVADGPISDFSAKGKTGNQLPDSHELSGRAGDGRSGASQGQLVEDVAKGLAGRKTPTRITNDPYEQGVVKELQQMKTSGATGGGKARGSGQEGLQGESPPPLMDNLKFMEEWQKRIRQKAERMAGQLKTANIHLPDFQKSIALMKDAEASAASGRYAEMFKVQQMVLQQLKAGSDQAPREATLQMDRAARVPPEHRRKVLDAMEEPMPQEYQGAVQRYFQKLSETK